MSISRVAGEAYLFNIRVPGRVSATKLASPAVLSSHEFQVADQLLYQTKERGLGLGHLSFEAV